MILAALKGTRDLRSTSPRWKLRTSTARSRRSVVPGRSRWWWIAPSKGGGGGLGFDGGQLLYLAVAGCISNDLFRDARAAGINLSRVRVKVGGDFVGEPAVSDEIRYEVEVYGDAPDDRLRELIDQVDEIAEIPNSLRQGTRVRLVRAKVDHTL